MGKTQLFIHLLTEEDKKELIGLVASAGGATLLHRIFFLGLPSCFCSLNKERLCLKALFRIQAGL